jgi:hypothetical protein
MYSVFLMLTALHETLNKNLWTRSSWMSWTLLHVKIRVVVINVDLQLLATSLQFGCFTLILKKPECTGCIENVRTNFRSEFPTRKEGRSLYQCMSTNTFIFRSIEPTFAQPHSCIFLSVGTLITPNVFSSNWKWRDISAVHFVHLSHHSQPPRGLGKGATVHDHTCLYVHWFNWRIFWTFVVSCDWINNKNSTVTKLGTVLWMYCVSCKWNITVKVFIVEFNLSIRF